MYKVITETAQLAVDRREPVTLVIPGSHDAGPTRQPSRQDTDVCTLGEVSLENINLRLPQKTDESQHRQKAARLTKGIEAKA
jgi:hypothetical protein